GQGTGLGLSICFGIISEHKGRIRAENNPGGGASFLIELPVRIPHAAPVVPSPSIEPAAVPAAPLRVLAIDDEPSLLLLLERIFRQLGHTIDTAADGQSALQKLQTFGYDLIICDILMPDLLGPELYEVVSQEYPELAHRFVFITGNVVDVETRLFLEKSGVPWLSKPFLPDDIHRVIGESANLALKQVD
ncbi:MAG: response regulator, partial [Anaerolineae bacterium]|nr:response regulator [Anaerolineae bacterium]